MRRCGRAVLHRSKVEAYLAGLQGEHRERNKVTVDEAEQTALRYWTRTSYKPNVIFRTSSVEAVRSMVARNMDVTILSDMVYRPWPLDGARIEATSIHDKVEPMNVGLARKREVEPSPPIKCIVDLLRDQFVERSTWMNKVWIGASLTKKTFLGDRTNGVAPHSPFR